MNVFFVPKKKCFMNKITKEICNKEAKMEDKVKQYILKELAKNSFLSDSNDVCFLSQDDIDKAVENGIKIFIEQIK